MAESGLRLAPELVRAMLEHARAQRPLEACGLLSGRGGRPTRFFPTRNAAASPVRYEVDPADLLAVTLQIEEQGEELWGIFHSHPQSEAYPSHTDIRLAHYPEAVYLIASLADPEHPVLRAFRIQGTDVRELPLAVEPPDRV